MFVKHSITYSCFPRRNSGGTEVACTPPLPTQRLDTVLQLVTCNQCKCKTSSWVLHRLRIRRYTLKLPQKEPTDAFKNNMLRELRDPLIHWWYQNQQKWQPTWYISIILYSYIQSKHLGTNRSLVPVVRELPWLYEKTMVCLRMKSCFLPSWAGGIILKHLLALDWRHWYRSDWQGSLYRCWFQLFWPWQKINKKNIWSLLQGIAPPTDLFLIVKREREQRYKKHLSSLKKKSNSLAAESFQTAVPGEHFGQIC